MKKSIDQLGELQQAVMKIVWKLGECSVHQVLEQFPRRKKPAYTTILTVMQKLEKSEWLSHRQEGRVYIYKARTSREEFGLKSIKRTIRQLLDGNTQAFMLRLISEEKLTEKELLELRHIIDHQRNKS